ncbi:hypothetical protein L1282_002182 [Chryseobacterium sp. HSC-36S06]|nr:hypothetical protein [Chryseobacterium sp. HSC-36S06]
MGHKKVNKNSGIINIQRQFALIQLTIINYILEIINKILHL